LSNQGNEETSTNEKCDEDKLKRLCAKYQPQEVTTPLELPDSGKAAKDLSKETGGLQTISCVHPQESAADAICKTPMQRMVGGGLLDSNTIQTERSLDSLNLTDEVFVVSCGRQQRTDRLLRKSDEWRTGDVSPHAGFGGEALQEFKTRREKEAAKSQSVDAENPSARLSAPDISREESLTEEVCPKQVLVKKNTLRAGDASNLRCEENKKSDIVHNSAASNSNDAAANKSVGRLDKTRFMAWEKSMPADRVCFFAGASKKHESIESRESSELVSADSTSRTAHTDETTSLETRFTSDSETRLLACGLSPRSNQVAEQCRENIIDLGLLADASVTSPIPSLFNKPGADELKLSVSCIEATVETRCARQAFCAWLLVACAGRSAAADQNVVFAEKSSAENESNCERSSPLVRDGASNSAGVHVEASDARVLETGRDCLKCEEDLISEIQSLQELLRKKTFLVESIRNSTGAASLDAEGASEVQVPCVSAQSQQVDVELAKVREDCRRLTHEAENSKKELLELRSKLIARSFPSHVQTFDISSPHGPSAGPSAESVHDICASTTSVFPLTIDVVSTPQADILRHSCPSTHQAHERSCNETGSQICLSAAPYLQTSLTSTQIRGPVSGGGSLETTRSVTSTPRRFSTPWLQDRRITVPVEVVSRKSPTPVQSYSRRSSIQGGLRLGDSRVTQRNVLPAATSSRHFRSGGSSMLVASRMSPGGVSVISRGPAVRAS
jgi:hypothetical protein